MHCRITAALARQEVEDIQPEDWILDSAVTHFFCADKTQFEALRPAEEEIRIVNEDTVKSAGRRTVRLLVNDKDHDAVSSKDYDSGYSKGCGQQSSCELLLHEVIYAPALEVNLLST